MSRELPDDLFEHILRYVPQEDRFGSCGVASSQLHAAAVSCTREVCVQLHEDEEERADSFDKFLHRYGGAQLTSLQLQQHHSRPLQLPWAQKLLSLDASGADFAALPLDMPGALLRCSGLTSLKLSCCMATSPGWLGSQCTTPLKHLSVLSSLRRLSLCKVKGQGKAMATLPFGILTDLVHLTSLDLESVGVRSIHYLSALSNLQTLRLHSVASPQQPLALLPDITLQDDFALPSALRDVTLGKGVLLDPVVMLSAGRLTRLVLDDCVIIPSGNPHVNVAVRRLSSLSQLVALQELQLFNVSVQCAAPNTINPPAAVPLGVLCGQLSCLTRLDLDNVDVADNKVQGVSQLSSLAVLHVKPTASSDWRGSWDVKIVPGAGAAKWALPSSLVELALGGVGRVVLHPTVVSPCVNLTHLELLGVRIVAQDANPETPTKSALCLLEMIAGLKQLETFLLKKVKPTGPELTNRWPPLGAVYQSPTASSRLRRLEVEECGLVQGVWSHVFAAGKISTLTQLLAKDAKGDSCYLGFKALSSIVKACPALHDLALYVETGRTMTVFKRLAALTRLDVCFASKSSSAPTAIKSLATGLTNLRELQLEVILQSSGSADSDGSDVDDDHDPSEVQRSALLPLTQLRALTSCDISGVPGNPYEQVHIHMETSPGKQPDVWHQLQEYCEQEDTDCDGSGGSDGSDSDEDDESSSDDGSDDGSDAIDDI